MDPETDGGDRGVVSLLGRLRAFVRAVGDADEDRAQELVLQLSRSRRLFAPLAFAVGGIAMLFTGLKLLLSNWRLTLVQILPAMWIWVAMTDLKAHVIHGKSFRHVQDPRAVVLVIAITAITALGFFLNAVFAFAIVQDGQPLVRPAIASARAHLKIILGSGAIVGLALGVSAVLSPRWGPPWFAVTMSIVVGAMMVSYVAVPSRLIGIKQTRSRRDKLAATAVGGAIGAVVCTPPYALGRIGLLMIGSPKLVIPGALLIAIGVTLQAGATGAVKAVKMSAKLGPPTKPQPSATARSGR